MTGAVLGRRRPDPGGGLPEAVDAVAAALAAGRSIHDGLRAATGTAPPVLAAEWWRVLDDIDGGSGVAAALDRWAATSEVPGAGLVATAHGLGEAAGGDVGRALASVATSLRERRALAREVRALSSQARMSAGLLAVAPIGFGAIAAAADPATAAFLARSPLGFACASVGVVLDALGWWWMRRITDGIR